MPRLWVSNLPWKVRDPGLKRLFVKFAKAGKMTECAVEMRKLATGMRPRAVQMRPPDGQKATGKKGQKATGMSKGFGFVSYDTKEDAEAAIKAMNGFDIEGRKLTVSNAMKRQNKSAKKNKDVKGEPPAKRRKLTKDHFEFVDPATMLKAGSELSGAVQAALDAGKALTSCMRQLRPLLKNIKKYTAQAARAAEGDRAKAVGDAGLVLEITQRCVGLLERGLEQMLAAKELQQSREGGVGLLKQSVERLLFSPILRKLLAADLAKLSGAYEAAIVAAGARWEAGQHAARSGSGSLEQQVGAHYRESSMGDEARRLREQLTERIRTAVRTKWPEAQVHIFGSTRTPLCNDRSDLDLGVDLGMGTGLTVGSDEYFADAKAQLQQVGQVLWNTEAKLPNSAVFTARVPLLRLKDKSRFLTEISVWDPSNARKADQIAWCCRRHENLAPFLAAVKHWASARDLSSRAWLGLPSYGFICLALLSLQAKWPALVPAALFEAERPGEYEGPAPPSLPAVTELLAGFFSFVTGLDPATQVVCCRRGELAARADTDQWADAFWVVADPVDRVQNCARNIKLAQWKRISRESRRAALLVARGAPLEELAWSSKDDSERKARKLFYS